MPQQLTTAVENNFTKGLITESTGLNFPENAATSTDNCLYTLIGDVSRRLGINNEVNYSVFQTDRSGRAVTQYKWNNAGAGGNVQFVIEQVGETIIFYRSSNATATSPLSAQFMTTINIRQFAAASFDTTLEAQYADGNGTLFIYHPSCDPLACTYTGSTIAIERLNVQIRDFTGATEPGIPIELRPSNLTNEHLYNLINQGWVAGNAWNAISTTQVQVSLGSKAFTVAAGITGIVIGSNVQIYYTGPVNTTVGPGASPVANGLLMAATVTSYAGTTLTLNIVSLNQSGFSQLPGINTYGQAWSISPGGGSAGYIATWNGALNTYPSNADVWWNFKNASNVFDPATTVANRTLNTGPAPKGHYVFNAFFQSRSSASGYPISDTNTNNRPRTGAWFAGRVWYSGVDGQQLATGDVATYSWTENVYFSQTVVDNTYLGKCYQANDPTSENLFDLLPTDGGVIVIQGSGNIYKLFPTVNGLLVFAGNGVWFITGSQGIGFAANDYTVTKISDIRSISGSSFVNVNGLPYFWNEEGIYMVTPSQNGALTVEPITIGTILTFYDDIPLNSKLYAKGAYDPINYVIQWVYRAEDEADNPNGSFFNTTARYEYTHILNFNTYNKAFYPYSLGNASDSINYNLKPKINGIIYVSGPGGLSTPEPAFKYFMSTLTGGTYTFTFTQEYDTSYVDFKAFDGVGYNYDSFFVTGYKLRGQAIRKFQPQYIQMYSRTNGAASAYKIQGIWDFSNSGNSGRWSTLQLVTNALTRYDTTYRRHKIRGHGYALQFKVTSVDGTPFDIQGWAVTDTTNQGA